MYPSSPAALLSYLVLRLIQCDAPRRQKTRLIQSNKLPTQGTGSPASSTLFFFLHAFLFFFFFVLTHRPEDELTWEDQVLNAQHFRPRPINDFRHVCVKVKGTKFCVVFFVCVFHHPHPSQHSHLHRSDSECATCVHHIPSHCCIHGVVILKLKTYNTSATATFELLN